MENNSNLLFIKRWNLRDIYEHKLFAKQLLHPIHFEFELCMLGEITHSETWY